MGSWTFVFTFLLAMAAWVALNSVFKLGHPLSSGSQGFDPDPHILLNLILSTMAGMQAAALLIAAKRADAIASEIALHTLQNTEADRELLVENTELTKVVKAHTDLLEELHQHVSAISEHLGLPQALPARAVFGVGRSINSLAAWPPDAGGPRATSPWVNTPAREAPSGFESVGGLATKLHAV